MGFISNFFKWIFGLFGKKSESSEAESEVKKEFEKEKKMEKFVDSRISEISESLVEAQSSERIAKDAVKIEQSGSATGKSLEEVEKEEGEMMLKLDEFEEEIGSFEKQLNQTLSQEEASDEAMEQKIDLAKSKSDEYFRKISADIDVFDRQWEILYNKVQLESNKVKQYIEEHRRQINHVREMVDGTVTRTMESIEGARKAKAGGSGIFSLFQSIEFSMSNLSKQLIDNEKTLSESRIRRDKFLEEWFKIMDAELEAEKTGEVEDEIHEEGDFWSKAGVTWK